MRVKKLFVLSVTLFVVFCAGVYGACTNPPGNEGDYACRNGAVEECMPGSYANWGGNYGIIVGFCSDYVTESWGFRAPCVNSIARGTIALARSDCSECGGQSEPCCNNAAYTNYCRTPLSCQSGTCVASACGGSGEACCAGNTCDAGQYCSSGTCVPSCYDSDGGENLNTRGYTTWNGAQQTWDSCSGVQVLERVCLAPGAATVTRNCPGGYTCSSGACSVCTWGNCGGCTPTPCSGCWGTRSDGCGNTDSCWNPPAGSCPAGQSCSGGLCVGGGGCTDECGSGEIGCADGNTKYSCGESGDGDSCLDKINTACLSGETCSAGQCVGGGGCTDECSSGEIGCADGNTKYSCGESGDGDSCLDKINTACLSGETCLNGNCEENIECFIEDLRWEKDGESLEDYVTEEKTIQAVVDGSSGCVSGFIIESLTIKEKNDGFLQFDSVIASTANLDFDEDSLIKYNWETKIQENDADPKSNYYFVAEYLNDYESPNITVVARCTGYESNGSLIPINSCNEYNFGVEGVTKQFACERDCADVIARRVEQGPLGETGQCMWNNNNCFFAYQPLGSPSNGDYYCKVETENLPNCEPDSAFRTISLHNLLVNKTTGVEREDALCYGSCGASQCEIQTPCPKIIELPFFGVWNILSVVAIIIVVYVVYDLSKRKKRRR